MNALVMRPLPLFLAALVGVLFALMPLADMAEARDKSRAGRLKRLAAVTSWGYQLRNLSIEAMAASPLDLVVVDYRPNRRPGYPEAPFTKEDVARMQRAPDGGRRVVLAYLSIGEAEDYRLYWQPQWSAAETKPAWIGPENPEWPGNYAVDFWVPEWQAALFGGPETYLARILAQGFDGIYLDRADAFSEALPRRKSAARDMVQLITKIAKAARQNDPGFLVVMQNAEELLRQPGLISILDGVAKEDLLFGVEGEDQPNPVEMVAASLGDLSRARKRGVRIFAVEYVTSPENAALARTRARKNGVLIHFAERSLGLLMLRGPDELEPNTWPAPPP